MILKLTIEIELDDFAYNFSDKERSWMESDILVDNGTLLLHSNEIGDMVGVVKSVTNIEWHTTQKSELPEPPKS